MHIICSPTSDRHTVMVGAFSKLALERPWYRDNDTAERNEAARRGYEAVLIVTLRHPDSPQYDQFARRVRRRAIRDYGYDVYGDEVSQSQSINQSINQSIPVY